MPTNDAGLSQIAGSVGYDYHSTDGVVRVPRDLSMTTIAAWVPRADGSYAEIDGRGFPDGTFLIDDVPEHLVYIQVGDDYVGTASRVLDLGADWMGRADRGFAGPDTWISFDVDNLRAWLDSDSLVFASQNLGLIDVYQFLAMPPIAAGASSLTDSDFQQWYLVDEGAGDRVSVYQLEERSLGGIPYEVPIRAFDAPPFTTPDGQTTLVTGSFQLVSEDQRLNLEWNAAAYAFQARDVHSEALWGYGELGLFAHAPGSPITFSFERPPVIRFPFVFGNETLTARDVAYGDVYPAEWPRFASACMFFGVEYALPNAESDWGFAEMLYSAPLEDIVDGQMLVKMSPVSNVLINGFPGLVARNNVTTTPTLSWNEPTIGATPSGYRIEILHVSIVDGGTRVAFVGPTFYTTERSLTLPPGIIADDTSFVARIAAIWMPNGDFASSPLRETLPYAMSEALTGLLTP